MYVSWYVCMCACVRVYVCMYVIVCYVMSCFDVLCRVNVNVNGDANAYVNIMLCCVALRYVNGMLC